MAVERSEGPSRKAWVVAGLQALSEEGIESVKVERLARRLNVSKGPFYWRFSDRNELLDAMLAYWKHEFTEHLIERSAALPAPRARLECLLELSLQPDTDDLNVAWAEAALRDWASRDSRAREAARQVDSIRLRHLVSELLKLGAPNELAVVLAKGMYLALLGLYTARRYTPELADDQAYRHIVESALNFAEAAD